MTTKKTDIENTLTRILGRELKEWPEGEEQVIRPLIGFTQITRADLEAERALLASEQAQPLGDSEEFDQALWDKVASDIFIRACDESIARFKSDEIEYVAGRSALYADAFMAERAKRIAARKASHD